MSRSDAPLKHFIAQHPRDWAAFRGVPRDAQVEVVDSDLSTTSFAADKVLKVRTSEPFILHLEPQSYYDKELDARVHFYNALLARRHRMAVHSTILLLHPGAWGVNNRGYVRSQSPLGRCRIDFEYDVVRIWEQPVASILAAGVGVLPLAPIADVTLAELPAVIERIGERFERETPRAEAADLWIATALLLGVKYRSEIVESLLKGVHHIMQESSTYQAIIEEGEKRGEKRGKLAGRKEGLLNGKRESLLILGRKQLGRPSEAVRDTIEKIASVKQLDNLLLRVLDAENWDELLSR
jgi:predicted transposase YdaD